MTDDLYELIEQRLEAFIEENKIDWAQRIAGLVDEAVAEALRNKVRQAAWTSATRWAEANQDRLAALGDQVVNQAAADLLLAYERVANPEGKRTA